MIENVTISVAGKPRTVERYTRGKAIRQFCKECMGGVVNEVRRCTSPGCPLWPFRPYQQKAPDTP